MKPLALMAAAAFMACCAWPAFADERPALLPTTVGLHLHSHHMGQRQWNDATTGMYARWGNGITAGVVRNSLRRNSAYVAWTGERAVATVAGMPVLAAVTAGVTSGYDRLVQDDFAGQPGKGQHTAERCDANGRCRQVLLRSVLAPLLVPSVALQVSNSTAVRLGWIHRSGTDADHAIHLSVEFKLP